MEQGLNLSIHHSFQNNQLTKIQCQNPAQSQSFDHSMITSPMTLPPFSSNDYGSGRPRSTLSQEFMGLKDKAGLNFMLHPISTPYISYPLPHRPTGISERSTDPTKQDWYHRDTFLNPHPSTNMPRQSCIPQQYNISQTRPLQAIQEECSNMSRNYYFGLIPNPSSGHSERQIMIHALRQIFSQLEKSIHEYSEAQNNLALLQRASKDLSGDDSFPIFFWKNFTEMSDFDLNCDDEEISEEEILFFTQESSINFGIAASEAKEKDLISFEEVHNAIACLQDETKRKPRTKNIGIKSLYSQPNLVSPERSIPKSLHQSTERGVKERLTNLNQNFKKIKI